ncbi:MAG: methyltransferase domain-containing protein [Chloroflexi bacterium]|nr:methyltransferase domain-containing protein [Chloroflexota bacterium]
MAGHSGPGEDGVVATANVEQAAGWDGEEGDRWTEHEERYNAAARNLSRVLLDAAGIAADDRVLDIGCGCGETTLEAARRAVVGMALGVDLSSRMIERARERSRAEGITNAKFEQADAQMYRFEQQGFDRVISRFGAMFFGDPIAAFRNIGRAVRPGGRLAMLTWQELGKNEWMLAIRSALAVGRTLPEPPVGAPGLFGLAEADAARRILAAAGFEAIDVEEVREPMYLGTDGADAFAFIRTLGMTKGMLQGLDGATAARALEALRSTLEAHDTGAGVLLDSCAWLITARCP